LLGLAFVLGLKVNKQSFIAKEEEDYKIMKISLGFWRR